MILLVVVCKWTHSVTYSHKTTQWCMLFSQNVTLKKESSISSSNNFFQQLLFFWITLSKNKSATISVLLLLQIQPQLPYSTIPFHNSIISPFPKKNFIVFRLNLDGYVPYRTWKKFVQQRCSKIELFFSNLIFNSTTSTVNTYNLKYPISVHSQELRILLNTYVWYVRI